MWLLNQCDKFGIRQWDLPEEHEEEEQDAQKQSARSVMNVVKPVKPSLELKGTDLFRRVLGTRLTRRCGSEKKIILLERWIRTETVVWNDRKRIVKV